MNLRPSLLALVMAMANVAAHAQTFGVTVRTQNAGAPVERIRVETGVATGQVLFVNSFLIVDNQQTLRFREAAANGTNFAALQAPAALAADYTLTLPPDDGAPGQVLSTDGAGALSWVAGGGGAVTSVEGAAGVVDLVPAGTAGLAIANSGPSSATFTLNDVWVNTAGDTMTGALTLNFDGAPGVPMLHVSSTDAFADTGLRLSAAGSMKAEIDTWGQFVFSNSNGNSNAGRIGGAAFGVGSGGTEFGTYPAAARIRSFAGQAGSLLLEGGTTLPPVANGTMYYDSGTNRFRGYENGAWRDLTVPAPGTAGRILYDNGTDWVVLAPGANGEVLTMVAGLPAWAAGGGGGTGITANFDAGLGSWVVVNSSATVVWAADATPGTVDGFTPSWVSAPNSLNYNNGIDFDDAGFTNNGTATSPNILLSATSTSLTFQCNYQTEDTGTAYDWRFVEVSNDDFLSYLIQDQLSETGFPLGGACSPMGTWHSHTYTLDPAWGTVKVRFRFDTFDGAFNNFSGWFVDDVVVLP